MTFSERISEFLIRFFINPFGKSKPIPFKSELQNAAKVLISCQSVEPPAAEVIASISGLFPRESTIVLLQPDGYPVQESMNILPEKPVPLNGMNRKSLWHLSRSDKVRSVLTHSFDLFLDLDLEFNLLNYYLCRKLNAPLRIGFKKPFSPSYFNVEYIGSSMEMIKNLEGLYHFLKRFL